MHCYIVAVIFLHTFTSCEHSIQCLSEDIGYKGMGDLSFPLEAPKGLLHPVSLLKRWYRTEHFSENGDILQCNSHTRSSQWMPHVHCISKNNHTCEDTVQL